MFVASDHPIAVVVLATLAVCSCLGQVGPEVHSCRVVPQEKGLIRCDLLFHPQPMALAVISSSIVSMRFLVKGPVFFNCLLSHPTPAWIDRRVILVGREAVKNASGSKLLP